jgi:hypothetical protein
MTKTLTYTEADAVRHAVYQIVVARGHLPHTNAAASLSTQLGI